MTWYLPKGLDTMDGFTANWGTKHGLSQNFAKNLACYLGKDHARAF